MSGSGSVTGLDGQGGGRPQQQAGGGDECGAFAGTLLETIGWLSSALDARGRLYRQRPGNARATRVILHALLEPATVDSWLPQPTPAGPWVVDPLPQIEGRLRHALLSAAIERTDDFEELLAVAIACVPFCSNLTIGDDWGPLLAAAFPSGYSSGAELTPAQHRFLSALADRDVCWRYTHLIASWFQDIGLPADRDAIKALLKPAR